MSISAAVCRATQNNCTIIHIKTTSKSSRNKFKLYINVQSHSPTINSHVCRDS